MPSSLRPADVCAGGRAAGTRLYPRRLDAESINRGIGDSLWIRHAHGVGHARQHLNPVGYALMVNALSLHRYQTQLEPDRLAA